MTPLLARVRRRQCAFERVYRRHVGAVYRYALLVLRDPDDAEEVTRTTFLTAYRQFGRGARRRNARAWLLALAYGACRERAPTDGDRPEDTAPARPDDRPPTESELCRALAHLPFDQQATLVLRELARRSYAEIAELLQLSPADVESLVFAARRAVREQLEGTLRCHEAEFAISRQIDGRLGRSPRRPLRRHLRECNECARFARSQRARRSALRNLAGAPLPASLRSFFGPSGVLATTVAQRGYGARESG